MFRQTLGISVLAVLMSIAVHAESSPEGPDPKDGFTIHEWGVFTCYTNQAFANAGRDAAWKELPKEVFGVTDGRTMPSMCVGADKPIVYFYNTKSLPRRPLGGQENLRVKVPGAKKHGNMWKWGARSLSLRVDFPSGAPMVWYPKTAEPLGGWWGSGKIPFGRQKAPDMSRWTWIRGKPDHLSWKLYFPVGDDELKIKCPAYKWRDEALKPKADPFSADFYLQDIQKFVFYEGLLPNKNKVTLKAGTRKGTYLLSNTGTFEALDVLVIDRTERTPRFARLASLPAGKTDIEVTHTAVHSPGADHWVKHLANAYRQELRKAGLFTSEADGLIAIWKKEFFETPGLHLLFRLPQTEYDRMLPLTAKPKPKRTVRVGLIWLPHLEPDLADRVKSWVAKLKDEDFEVRQDATSTLKAMGPAALPHLQKLLPEQEDPEVRLRISSLLKGYTTDPEQRLKEWKRLQKKAPVVKRRRS